MSLDLDRSKFNFPVRPISYLYEIIINELYCVWYICLLRFYATKVAQHLAFCVAYSSELMLILMIGVYVNHIVLDQKKRKKKYTAKWDGRRSHFEPQRVHLLPLLEKNNLLQ